MGMKLLDQLVAKLRDAGRSRWPAIAKKTGVRLNSLEKIAYGEYSNPKLATLQALLDYFAAIDAGSKKLPPKPPRKTKARPRRQSDPKPTPAPWPPVATTAEQPEPGA